MTISTSIWGAHHPNAGRNIQQTRVQTKHLTEKLGQMITGLQTYISLIRFSETHYSEYIKEDQSVLVFELGPSVEARAPRY